MFLRRWLHHRIILVVVFESRRVMVAAMDDALAHGLGDLLDIGHAALIVRPADSAPVIVNNNVTAQEGTISGAMIGAALLALGVVQLGALDLPRAGAALAVAVSLLAGSALGGVIGRVTAGRVEFGFRPELLGNIATQLAVGEVALVLQVRQTHVPRIRDELARHNARIDDRSGEWR